MSNSNAAQAPRRRLLLVEDDVRSREVLKRLLQSEGWDVSACESAEAALEELAGGNYDFLLSDFVLPGMTGLALAEHDAVNAAGLPCVIMSGRPEPNDMPPSVVNWLRKPLDFDALLTTLA